MKRLGGKEIQIWTTLQKTSKNENIYVHTKSLIREFSCIFHKGSELSSKTDKILSLL